MPRAARLYVPLDAAFFDDDKVVRAGEAAGWLYLAMCARAKQLDNDGVMNLEQVERLHIKGWQKRLQTLIEVDLVVRVDDRIGICGWLNWNESSAERAAKRERDRIRKAKKYGEETP